jgi:Fe-S oxidoreductase
MAGRLGEAGLSDDGVREVLDLCLECRACKAECPVGVDVARFKSEFLAAYWDRHGPSLRARVLGHIHDVSRWGSRLAPLSNWIARSALVRWLNEQALDVDRRRMPPAWASKTFAHRFRRLRAASAGQGRRRAASAGQVLLFNDTFTNYYTPAIGMAGLEVLQIAGFDVGLAPTACCGRPLISQGLLAAARRAAELTTDRLYSLVENGRRIVFFEPSCFSAIREDLPSLLRGDAGRRAQVVAERSMLFEEFVESECQAARTALDLMPGPSRILLHGHCHQKAMGRLAPAKALLSRIPESTVVDLDAGCCGMAGSFGYVRDHFEVSRAIGERRLFPAARNLSADSVLVASGTSCRHQIADFTSAQALHPAQLIRSLVREPA